MTEAKENSERQSARIDELEARLADVESDHRLAQIKASKEQEKVKKAEKTARGLAEQAAQAEKRELEAEQRIAELTLQLAEARDTVDERVALSTDHSTSSRRPSDDTTSLSAGSSPHLDPTIGRGGSLPLSTISSSLRGFRESLGSGDPQRTRWALA